MAINFVRKIVSNLTGRRKIYFLVENSYSGTSVLKGRMICRQIQKFGYYSNVFDIRSEEESNYVRIKDIKNSLFVVIRRSILNKARLLERLKKYGNKLIWDPADGLVELKDSEELQMFDGVIWANRKCAQDMATYLPKNCHGGVIYHHWDPRCKKNHCKGYELLFLGDPTPGNISQEYVENIKDLHIESVKNIGDMEKKGLI